MIGVAFANYFILGDRIKEVSSLQGSLFVTYRFMSGAFTNTEMFKIEPGIFIFISLLMLIFYFYIFLPVSIAVLLDSFS
jgi:hypothetical protein